MEPIMKENEFAKITFENGTLTSLVKSKFVKKFYYYDFSSSQDIGRTALTAEVKKMRIHSAKPIVYVLVFLAIVFFAAGYTYSIEGGSGDLVTGLILAILTLFAGFLFQRSKAGKLRVMWTYVKGSIFVVYASLDVSELQSLRQAIESTNHL
jgi:hypothetical protein